MGIFQFEWRQYRKSAIVWALSLGIFSFIFTRMFADTVMNQMSDLKELLESNSFYAAMGLDSNTFFSILGLFGYLNGILSLVASIQAMSLGMTLITKEHMYNTVDFLMTKPYRRGNVFSQKVLSAILALVLSSGMYMICSVLAVHICSSGTYDRIACILICMTFPLIQFLFLSLGMLVGTIKSRIPNVLPISIGTAFVLYFIGMGAEVLNSNILRCFSPFKYYNTTYMIEHHSYEIGYLVLNIVIIVLFLFVAKAIYQHKDLKSL